ncbi:MAG: ATP-NAD kinase [delta proteobacterium ML8_F1]|nr:MAG: ATP-NAD kinase [delta proteobacterium ML8_F1]
MTTIGIIANPASGKDIRRLVSHATVIDNNEKVNIIERVILGAQTFGVKKIYVMPDSFMMGFKVMEKLELSGELNVEIEILDMKIKASPKDTQVAATMLEEMQVGCIVVLGGDGTHRLVAKAINKVPLIGISTGTNNAYPKMLEGTVAGMAAAAAATNAIDYETFCERDKIIEVSKNGELVDIALMDVVISDEIYIGAKAIWNLETIKHVIVSNCHPASIGFSAILGANIKIEETDDFGAALKINSGTNHFLAPIAAGSIVRVTSEEVQRINLGESFTLEPDYKGMIALDGEREVSFVKGDLLSFKILRNGPRHVVVNRILESALENGFFQR